MFIYIYELLCPSTGMGIVRKENRMANEAYLNKLIDSFINNGQIPSEKISTYAEEQTGSSVFASDEKINYTSSPFFEYNSSQEDELTTFSTAHTTDTITENAVNLFTNYTISKGCGDIQNCPKELLELFNNKIDMIENAFKELSGKNLSENEILEKLNEVIKNALNQDTEFLEKIFSDLKDNPQELEKILKSKICMTAEKQEFIENKIQEYCSKNSISPELTEKIIDLIQKTNLSEIENLKNKAVDENSPLSATQKEAITSSCKTETEEIENGVKSMTKEEAEKKKEEIRQILNNLPKEVREQISEEITQAHLALIDKLKAAAKCENSFEARKAALIEYDEKMNKIFENISKQSILHHIAGIDSEETKKGIEIARKNLTDIGRLSLRRKHALLRRKKDKELVSELELQNIPKRHQAFMKGAEEAFDEKPSETENVEAVFNMFEEVSKEHTRFTSEDAATEANLSDASKAKLKAIAEKIRTEIQKVHSQAVKDFWKSSAGQKCIEYTKRMYEYRKASYERRKREIEELKEKTVEKRKEAKKAQKNAFAKKEAATKIKQQVLAKQHEMKKKLGLSSNFKLTDTMLKNVDYQLAVKKKRADNEFSDARKAMINAESDARLANYFLIWAEKLASFEQKLCSIYENFLG